MREPMRLIIVIALLLGAWLVAGEAQSLPVTRTVEWDASPAADQTIDYTVTFDGVVVGTTSSTSLPVTFSSLGAHTLTVTARNVWGAGPAGVLNVVVSAPGAATGIRIRVQ